MPKLGMNLTQACARSAQAAAALLLVLLVACGGGGDGSATGDAGGTGGTGSVLSADVYPLATGDRRTWRSTAGPATGTTRSERVGALKVLGTRQTLEVRSEDGSSEYLERTAGAVVSVPGPGSDPLSLAAGPVDILRFGVAVGDTSVLFDRTLAVDLDDDGRADSLDLRVESTFIGTEAISTTAGSFPASAHVRTVFRSTLRLAAPAGSSSLVVTSDEWFAPGVGPVRSSISTVVNGGAAEVEVEEVVAYGVGTKRSESVAPVLESATPSAESLAAPDTLITLTFSEALDPLALDGAAGINLVNATGSAVATTRSLSADGRQLVLTPQSSLADGRYELRTGPAVTDLANNALASSTQVFFVDTSGPRLASSLPAKDATEAPLTGTLSLTYSEPVFAAMGDVRTLVLSDDVGSNEVYLPAVIQGKTISAVLQTPLLRNQRYFLRTGLALTDAAGNSVQSTESSISFYTDPGPLARPTALWPDHAISAVTQGDINGDGRMDLLFEAQVIGSSEHVIGARLQQADGRYAASQKLAALTFAAACSPRSLAIGDFNGDGRADIAANTCPGQTFVALLQQANGGFVAETKAADILSPLIAAIDIDNDGQAELATGAFTEFRFLRRNASGVWASALTVDAGTTYMSEWRMADINRDGKNDLVWLRVASDESSLELAWALRDGAGFGATRSRSLGGPSNGQNALAVADVSGDGRADVLVLLRGATEEDTRLAVLRQDAGGDFTAPVSHATFFSAATVSAGDVDGDGKADVVMTHSATWQVGVYLQAGNGSLQAERLFETGFAYYEYTEAVALLDLDANGRIDLVVAGDVLMGRPSTGAWPLLATGRAQSLKQHHPAATSTARNSRLLRHTLGALR